MSSIHYVRKIVTHAPRYLMASDVDKISSFYFPAQNFVRPKKHQLFESPTVPDKYMLNWFNEGWKKTMESFSENWESFKNATSGKNRKAVDNAKSKISGVSKSLKNKSNELVTDSKNLVNDVSKSIKDHSKNLVSKSKKSIQSTVDGTSKVKNKALTDNWDAIRIANSKNNKQIVDDLKQSATTTVDEISKTLKEKADKTIDEKTKDIKNRIKKKGDKLKQKISK